MADKVCSGVRFSLGSKFIVGKSLIFATVLCGLLNEGIAAEKKITEKNDSQSEKNATASTVAFKFRYAHPFGAVDLIFTKDKDKSPFPVINLVDLALGVEVLSLVYAEFGGYYELWNSLFYGESRGYFGRLGLMPVAVNKRRLDHRGSVLQVGGLAGIRGIIQETYHDDYYYCMGLFVTLAGALDYTYWLRKHFGICFRLLIDNGLPFYQTSSSDWKSDRGDMAWYFRFALEAGVAF